jgi:AcrR family transcriptional regulator
MRRTIEDSLQTRETLLDAAMSTFLRKGYAETRVEDIAGAAEVTRGAFYHHFEGKEEIYRSLVAERCRPAMAVAARLNSKNGSPREKLRAFVAGYLTRFIQDKGFREAIELTALTTAFIPELEDSIAAGRESARSTLGWFKETIRSSGGKNPEEAAFALYGALRGVITLWLTDPTLFRLEGKADRIADQIMKIVEVSETEAG